MRVLLVSGSPHLEGCTVTALREAGEELVKYGIETELFRLGSRPVRGCIACGGCKGKERCVFSDEPYDELRELVKGADGFIFGSPVYYAAPNGMFCALLDRLFYSTAKELRGKPGAAVVSCRRGGASAAFDRLNKYFTINRMPVVSSQYWNAIHGNNAEEAKQDLEGLQIMRTLGSEMAYLLKSLSMGGQVRPVREAPVTTNFIH